MHAQKNFMPSMTNNRENQAMTSFKFFWVAPWGCLKIEWRVLLFELVESVFGKSQSVPLMANWVSKRSK